MKTAPLHICQGPRAARGFTLVEILIGLALFSMLVGGIFAVQKGALDVSREVVDSETKTLRMHSFCELHRRTFEQMPGNAKVNLQYYGGSGSDLTEVALTDYPLAYAWPGVNAGAKTIIFRTERSSAGGIGLQAAIIYLDEEQATEYAKKGEWDVTRQMGRITIMDDIAALRWRFYDETLESASQAGMTEQAWVYEWPQTNNRRPTQVEMELQFMDGSDPVKLVFWIPTMVSPQQFTSNFAGMGAGAGGPGGTGGPAIPGAGGAAIPGQPGAGGNGGAGGMTPGRPGGNGGRPGPNGGSGRPGGGSGRPGGGGRR